MTIFAASLSNLLMGRGTVVSIDGYPRRGDMLRICHANGTHTAGFIKASTDERLVLTMQGHTWILRCNVRAEERSNWVIE